MSNNKTSIENNKNDTLFYKTSEIFKNFYDNNFEKLIAGIKRNNYFYSLKDTPLLKRVSRGQKILDIGCSTGDLLKKLDPSYGVGVDISDKFIEYAKQKNPGKNLNFIQGDIYSEATLKEIGDYKFDVIVLSNTLVQVHDVVYLLKLLHRFCHVKTRIYVSNYSKLWQPITFIAECLKMRLKSPAESWIPPDQFSSIFYMSDFEIISFNRYILFPVNIPVLSDILNKYIAHLPFFELFCLMNSFILRPVGERYKNEISQKPKVSVVIPCKDEAGHIYELIEKLPELNSDSEYIFVEGNSTDNTEEIIKSVIKENPDKPFKFYKQNGIGKGGAVRTGFSNAKGDILAILDADITVSPGEMPSFINLLIENKADFINGSRLVYPTEKGSIKILDMLINKFYITAFGYVLGQRVRDMLCGTKVLWKNDYEKIERNREYFGDFDPYGDFDLIFGASKLGLKMLDFPVRYGERSYGDKNISGFRHGIMLFKMLIYGYKKNKNHLIMNKSMDLVTDSKDLKDKLTCALDHSFNQLLNLDTKKTAEEFLSKERAIEQIELFKSSIGVELFNGKKLLEIGSGVGSFIVVARKIYNIEAFGVEPSEDEFSPFLEISNALMDENKLPNDLIYSGNAETLPFDNESFDLIYSSNVIEHVNDPKLVIRESIRVLKPGGYLQFVIPNYFSFWEGHYGVLWPCILNKSLGKLYVKMLGKNPAFIDTLQLINPFYLKSILSDYKNEIEILTFGKEIFKERLTSGNYQDWASLKTIRPLVTLIQKLKIANLIANILNRLEMYTPVVLTIKKLNH